MPHFGRHHDEKHTTGLSKGFARVEERPFHRTENIKQGEGVSDPTQIALAMAQRIDKAGKLSHQESK